MLNTCHVTRTCVKTKQVVQFLYSQLQELLGECGLQDTDTSGTVTTPGGQELTEGDVAVGGLDADLHKKKAHYATGLSNASSSLS
ncbi:unnamed protein product [Nezara viridula]|uniref:Uncharacterized protein n=1 Tax=Nezara viridula TaxID=85310 RepID=A0A9P0H0F1_NEZVI|nr:unnamed protein product [Nezara viridula]